MAQENNNLEFQIILKGASYLRTHWYVFVLEVLLIASGTLFIFNRTPQTYQSTGSLLIDLTRKNFYQSFMAPGLSQASLSMRKQNIVILLTGQEVMEYFRNNLTEFYENEGKPPYLRPYFPRGIALAGSAWRPFITLTTDKMSDIYYLRCNAGTAEAALAICVNYMNTVEAYYPEIGQRETMLKRQYISEQIQKLNQQTQESEKALTEFQENKPQFFEYILLYPDEKASLRLRDEINDAKNKIAGNRSLRQKFMSIRPATKGEFQDKKKAIDGLIAQLNEYRYQMVLLDSSIETDRDVKKQAVKLRIRETQAALDELNRADLEISERLSFSSSDLAKKMNDLDIDYANQVNRLKQLQTQFDDLLAKDRIFHNDKREYERIIAELNNRKRLLQNLYSKEQETQLELSTGSAEIFRLEEPQKISFRVTPQVTKFTYAGLSMSILIILCTVAILIVFVPRLDSEADVNRFNLPILGKIPYVKINKNFGEISSASMEFLKIMNYRVLRETKDIRCPVVILTSPYSREGKTTVTQLLALSSQAPKRRSLLIDGDLQTTRPTKFFSINENQTPGVAGILEAPSTLSLSTMITKTVHEGIDFMPRGQRLEPSGDPNFLQPMKDILNQCRGIYDVIYIDSPPLFATSLSQFWLEFADLIIVVARVYYSQPKDIQESISMCKLFSKAPVGLALNGVKASTAMSKKSNYYFSKRKSTPFSRAA